MPRPSSTVPAGLGFALAATGTAQALATLAVFALPVLVAQAAPDFGLSKAAIGYQVGIVYLFAALTAGWGTWILVALGPLRTTQVALLAAGAAWHCSRWARWVGRSPLPRCWAPPMG